MFKLHKKNLHFSDPNPANFCKILHVLKPFRNLELDLVFDQIISSTLFLTDTGPKGDGKSSFLVDNLIRKCIQYQSFGQGNPR